MPRPQEILPSHYYHDHFKEIVTFVVSMYGDILGVDEKHFLMDFEALSHDAQCLFIRICNRKRTSYSHNNLAYPEITDITAALDELRICGWLRTVECMDYEAVLCDFTKDEIFAVLEYASGEPFKKSWAKKKLMIHVMENVSFEIFHDFSEKQKLLIPARRTDMQFLLYLYFGKANDSLTAFALRDLGLIAANDKQTYSARFYDLAEAKAGFFYTNAIKSLKSGTAGFVESLMAGLGSLPVAETEYTSDLRNTTLFMLGTRLERSNQPERALACYSLSNSYDCRERLVRLLHAQGEKDKVESLLSAMMTDPASDEEHIFATDFYARKFNKKRIGALTELLRTGEQISVDETYRGSPEIAALTHYKKTGWQGAHVENTLWNSLFGLLFWEELFEHPGSLSGAFDYLPHLLKNKQFYSRHASSINAILERLRSKDALGIILANYETNKDTPNGIFGWHDGLQDIVSNFVMNADPHALATMMQKMAIDYHGMSDGFPDLMIFKADKIRFIEVKSEGDQIRRRQLLRFRQLREAGFDVEILKVSYHADPDQIYVVVDVETTGGRPPHDRVTEIGAVKIQNGKVIGEWSSLINPEKHISSFITELTGITNAMVADAPVFADIAEQFSEFMDGCVFVAHNVNFDYGFIASEYRRLEIPFKLPKLCTCSSMRKHYPRQSSYGLGNLCREFGIPLLNHHRALNDAKAAAELLTLIYEKTLRQEKSKGLKRNDKIIG